MEKIDIIFWILGGGFALMFVMWNSIHQSLSHLNLKIDKTAEDLNAKISKLDEKIDKVAADLNAKIEKLDAKMDRIVTELTAKIEKVEAKLDMKAESIQHALNDLDKRCYGIETAMHMKECCVLKQDTELKKAE